MSSKDLLVNNLSTQFQDFIKAAQGTMSSVFSVQAKEFEIFFDNEKKKFAGAIGSKDKEIDDLTVILRHLTGIKKLRTEHLHTVFARNENKRKLQQALYAWISYYSKKKRARKMNAYVLNFFKRNSLRRDFKNWKKETQTIHREKFAKFNAEKIQREIEIATNQVNEECDTMRKMICELTEDLRNETLAKVQLKHKFEQALYRGISALNVESSAVQQENDFHSTGFSENNKAKYATPGKINLFK